MPYISNLHINYWWVTARKKPDGKGWHWYQFLESQGARIQGYGWGGPDWIKSPLSFKNIEQMRRSDIAVAYQSGEGIVGLVTLASNGYQHEGSKHIDTFNLDWKHFIRLNNPIPLPVIRALPNSKETFQFLKIGRGTVFTIERLGFDRLIRLISAFNMDIEQKITRFISAPAA